MSPRRLAWLWLLAATAALFAVWLIGSRPPGWYPPCLLRVSTGLLCPGCGSGRTVHALAHGEWASALALNPFLVLLLPFGLIWLGQTLWRGLRHNLPPEELPRPAALIILIAVMTFWVLRNLPWWPFTLLAPHG